MRFKSFALAVAVAGIFLAAQAEASTVSRAVITFEDSVGDRFALDNIIGDATNIDFTEVSAAPVDGLAVDGVTFGFDVGGSPSGDAVFGGLDLSPFPFTHLDGLALEGSASGTLTLEFAIPTSFLSFGLSLNGTAPSPVFGATVSLFDAADNLIGTFLVDVLEEQFFPEALFEYQVAAVPVPAALPLLVAGLAGLGVLRIRRRSRGTEC